MEEMENMSGDVQFVGLMDAFLHNCVSKCTEDLTMQVFCTASANMSQTHKNERNKNLKAECEDFT